MSNPFPDFLTPSLRFRVPSEHPSETLSSLKTQDLLHFVELGKTWGGMVHDLCNQLTVATGYLVLLLRNPQTSDWQKEHLLAVLGALKPSTHLLEQAVRMMRGDALDREEVSLNDVLDRAILEVKQLNGFNSNLIRIERNYDLAMPLLLADPFQIQRVFVNLIRNSIQSVKENGVGDMVTVTSWHHECQAYVSVHDNGPGFCEKILADPGQPLLTTRRDQGGMGLGLVIADQIVKTHGGMVALRNHPDGGAEVIVILPSIAST